MSRYHVVLASNSYHQVQCFGSPTGRVFPSEAAAQRMVRKLEKLHPSIDWLALPICPTDTILERKAS